MSSIQALIKGRVNSTLAERGYALRWNPPAVVLSRQRLEVTFPLLAAHLMLRRPRPFFVNIGANDGVTHDPIGPFVREHGWRGVMIEPIPEAFAALRANYAGVEGVHLVEAAIGKEDGTAEIFSVDGSDAAGLHQTLHSSFSRDVLLRARTWYPDIESRIITRTVRVLTLPTVLREIGAPQVDVLKIDVEGFDLQILRTIDLGALRPQLVLVEHAHLSRSDKIEMADRLLAAGYKVAMTDLDMLGYRYRE